MSTFVPQRSDWYGEPQLLSPAWTLTKGSKTAKCTVWSHQFGFELRLAIGEELIQSDVCRSQEAANWFAAMVSPRNQCFIPHSTR
jgi:hypothetical protein